MSAAWPVAIAADSGLVICVSSIERAGEGAGAWPAGPCSSGSRLGASGAVVACGSAVVACGSAVLAGGKTGCGCGVGNGIVQAGEGGGGGDKDASGVPVTGNLPESEPVGSSTLASETLGLSLRRLSHGSDADAA